MQCVQNSPGPPRIKFLPKQPLPRPRATYLASLSLHSTPPLSAHAGAGLGQIFSKQLSLAGPSLSALNSLTHGAPPSCSASPPPPSSHK